MVLGGGVIYWFPRGLRGTAGATQEWDCSVVVAEVVNEIRYLRQVKAFMIHMELDPRSASTKKGRLFKMSGNLAVAHAVY